MRRFLRISALLAAVWAAVSAAAQDSGILLGTVEYVIDGNTRRSAVESYLGIEPDAVFSDEAALEDYVEGLKRRLFNNRVFDPESTVEYEIRAEASGRRTAHLTVKVVDSLAAVAIPLPKYSSSDGFSLALRYKNYNFLGTLQTFTLNLDWFASTGKIDVGTDGSLPFKALGAEWKFAFDVGLVVPRDAEPIPDVTLSLGGSYDWGPEGREWFLSPAFSYDYDPSDGSQTGTAGATYGIRYEWGLPWTLSTSAAVTVEQASYSSASLTNGLNLGTRLVLANLGYLGDLTLSPATTLYVTTAFPETEISETGWTSSGTLGAGRVDWLGNFRRGASFKLGGAFTRRFLYTNYEDRWDGTVILDASVFTSWKDLVGINARLTGRWFADWTSLSDPSTDFDWDDYFRGRTGTFYGDIGAALNLELPVNLAQGKFFGASMFEAEVFLVPFLDLGFVRTDPAQPLDFERFGMAFAGCEFVVYPTRARAFAYRLSLGYDALDFLRTKDFDAGKLEIFLGLGTLF